jgi:hypothetical protein
MYNWILLFCAAISMVFPSSLAQAKTKNFQVYGIHNALHMGNPDEPNSKDLYINMGARNGIKVGSVVEILKTVSTYDLSNKKLFREITFPFGKAKIIHAEDDVAVARVIQLNPSSETPVAVPYNVQVGDSIRATR